MNDESGDSDLLNNENDAKRQKQLSDTLPQFRRMSLSPLSVSDDGVPMQKPISLGDGRNQIQHFSSIARAQTAMFFYYLFLGENGVPCFHVEEREDRRCPLCFFDAVSDSFVLLAGIVCISTSYLMCTNALFLFPRSLIRA